MNVTLYLVARHLNFSTVFKVDRSTPLSESVCRIKETKIKILTNRFFV
jgi:hypothetical protein